MSETKPEPDLAGMDWIDKNLNGVDLTGMTFKEVEAKYGEEAAIHAGIAADPDTWDFDMSRARPAAEVLPDLVARYEREQAERRKRGPQKGSQPRSISASGWTPTWWSTSATAAGAGRPGSTPCSAAASSARARPTVAPRQRSLKLAHRLTPTDLCALRGQPSRGRAVQTISSLSSSNGVRSKSP